MERAVASIELAENDPAAVDLSIWKVVVPLEGVEHRAKTLFTVQVTSLPSASWGTTNW
jgi:hypothetical protein